MTRDAGTPATCMLLSLLRLPESRPIADITAPARPEGAGYWSLRPENLTEDGAVRDTATVFCVVGLFAQGADATRAFAMRAGRLPADCTPRESLHLLLRPQVHRGALNWIDRTHPGTVFDCPQASAAATGPVLSMTTAGYSPGAAPSAARIARFISNTVAVGVAMADAPGLLFRRLFGPGPTHGDAITFSLWQSATALANFAYGAGPHRERMVTHAGEPFFDRASFTRFAIDGVEGTWDGIAATDLRRGGAGA